MPPHPSRVSVAVALPLLVALLFVGARPVGSLPALGPLLEPAHGAWALARTAELPRDAEAPVTGLGGDVRVVYDRRRVPHIFAAREEDAYRALGFVVARDRLFQLFLQTMAASGRLTELAGARALPLDRAMRRLGLPWAAEREVAVLDSSPTSARLVRAYADGVNAYLARMPAAELPLELRLLGVRMPRWEAINSVHLINRMGWTLSYMTPEIDRAAVASRVGTRAAASLVPENSPIQEPIQPNGNAAPRLAFAPVAPPGAPDGADGLVAAVRAFFPERLRPGASADDERPLFASNNWAVAPARSASGHALLAGDPHLELTLPSIWYEAHLVVPGQLDVYGVTIPGAPGIVIGFNRDLAWTFTNTSADVLDFYLETVDDSAHPTRYQVDGRWRPLERRIETYRDRGGATVAVDTLYFTHRGPMRRDPERGIGGGRWVSMRWTVLEPSRELESFQAAAHARTAAEFHATMTAGFLQPAQNMLVADRAGAIAIRSTGHFPVRPDDGSGFVVRDGSRSASDWRGYLRPEQYPQSWDPAQGYVASANQQPIDPAVATYWFGGEYDPWRALRINALLRADSQVTPDAMRRYQTDPGSARADFLVPFFLRAAERTLARPPAHLDTAELRRASQLLAQWDRRYTRENTRAVLFEDAMAELVDATWDELEAPASRDAADSARTPRRVFTPSSPVLAELLGDSTNAWWDDRRTRDHVETRDEVLARSLVAALAGTRRRLGESFGGGWRWDHVRHANIWHSLRLPALSRLDLPVQGGPETLSPSSGAGRYGPSWRMVVELGPEPRAMATYPGGQSGNPASAYYANNLRWWLAGELEPLVVPRAPNELAGDAVSARLLLRPGGAR